MLHLINKEKGEKYTFIVKSDWINNIEYNSDKPHFVNDVFSKYSTKINHLEGELIVCSNINKIVGFCKKIINETYTEYKEIIEKRDWTKEQWVYNILDGVSEQDKIIYRDEHIVIVPNYTWANLNDISKMYILVFPTDKSLHTLRDLTHIHINLLSHIKNKTLEIIKSTFGFDYWTIKMFIHYAPSTYHLHIHFVLISNTDVSSSVEYSHDIDSVINILKIKSDYYQSSDIICKKRI